MFMNRILVSAVLAAGMIGAVATPLSSVAQVEVKPTFSPPALRYEPVPELRGGYDWSPGHWQWEGNRYVWGAGDWQLDRPGLVYQQPALQSAIVRDK